MHSQRIPSRRAGILVPLFSLASTQSWGIGEIGDLAPMARWLSSAGHRLLQLLPINEMTPGETSPYSAMSAMAIDPQFISMASLEDFHAIGGEAGLVPALRARLEAVRTAPRIDYQQVRGLKLTVLRRAYTHFRDTESAGGTRRAGEFRAYVQEQAWWIDDYALFRALHSRFDERAWHDWPEALRTRQPTALESARCDVADDILFRQYLQWIAGDQWRRARDEACGVAIFGDLPFMVSADSADVWARQEQFDLRASVGVPPDAFSETGQDWGLPVYRWDVLADNDFDWLRIRARRYADLYDGYRVDHLVGFYRTYFRPHDGGSPQFTPAQEEPQLALGERVLGVFGESGAEIIAEDLGTVPDFVRESLARLGVPGYRVFRWERHWGSEGQPFRDPVEYPATAVATSGTHDTEPMAMWWDHAPREEKQAVLAIPSVRDRLSDDDRAAALEGDGFSHAVRDALLEALYASGAGMLILPLQDVFGWRDRINEPGTVTDDNWTWRLPWPVNRISTEPVPMAAAIRLREWSARHGR
jgi:4-alpha-glucanotransferase